MSEMRGAVLCLTCAWRENCQKKYSLQGSLNRRCLEYERDLRLKADDFGDPSRDPSKKDPG
ncbi:MAG: hypothetical protein V2A77_02820 [Pseudomonadota bacterium]